MRGQEIKLNEDYAVKTHPTRIPHRGQLPRILRARAIEAGTAKTLVVVEPQSKHSFETWVPNLNVLQPWSEYAAEQRKKRADAERAHREMIARYERETAERREWVERFAEAFRGIIVQPFSTANFKQDDVDLADELLRSFGQNEAGTMVRPEVFEAISKRIETLNEIVTQNALTEIPEGLD